MTTRKAAKKAAKPSGVPRAVARVIKRRVTLAATVVLAQTAGDLAGNPQAVGELHEAAVLAAVKAAYPGRQTTKNIAVAYILAMKGYAAELRARSKSPNPHKVGAA